LFSLARAIPQIDDLVRKFLHILNHVFCVLVDLLV
jgi:hypothetical protein